MQTLVDDIKSQKNEILKRKNKKNNFLQKIINIKNSVHVFRFRKNEFCPYNGTESIVCSVMERQKLSDVWQDKKNEICINC